MILSPVAGLALVWFASAPMVQAPKPLTDSQSVTVTATIEAIDKTSRTVTLKGPKGNLAVVHAGPEVARFDDLKVGDTVTATYTESIAVSVRRPGDPAPPAMTESVTPREGKPGATAARQETVTVTVQEIDRAVPSVTVKTADGRVLSFRIQDPKRLDNVNVGDKVDITYTKALLLKADPVAR
jgi:Cu/Ag efflux protein CusF